MHTQPKQQETPLYDALREHAKRQTDSFHVPGHKNGVILPNRAEEYFQDLLQIDLTEITGLDDLHHPEEAIREAQQLLSSYFDSVQSYFLVGGSTAGNLAMILATQQEGKPFLVQRNCHKSIIHALELAGAHPVFLHPVFEEETGRFGPVSYPQVEKALHEYPDAAGLILTYPDYYGRTYNLKPMIEKAHEQGVPVLIDEAHGVHFSLGHPIPPSSLDLGADVVVQSAHKMAPAMTMGAYLHIGSTLVDEQKIANYLQMVQSSSPSYPIMASLDLARFYLAHYNREDVEEAMQYIERVRSVFQSIPLWDVLSATPGVDDPFKLTLQVNDAYDAQTLSESLEQEGIYPELTTDRQILLVLGLEPTIEIQSLQSKLHNVYQKQSPTTSNVHATIVKETIHEEQPEIQKLAYSYQELNRLQTTFLPWSEVEGKIASLSVIPYPPGIPLIMKGERIKMSQIEQIQRLMRDQVHIQSQESEVEKGIHIYIE